MRLVGYRCAEHLETARCTCIYLQCLPAADMQINISNGCSAAWSDAAAILPAAPGCFHIQNTRNAVPWGCPHFSGLNRPDNLASSSRQVMSVWYTAASHDRPYLQQARHQAPVPGQLASAQIPEGHHDPLKGSGSACMLQVTFVGVRISDLKAEGRGSYLCKFDFKGCASANDVDAFHQFFLFLSSIIIWTHVPRLLLTRSRFSGVMTEMLPGLSNSSNNI